MVVPPVEAPPAPAPTPTVAPVVAPPPEPEPTAEPEPPPPTPDAERFGAKHLVVQYKGSTRASPNVTRTKAQAKARCEEAFKKSRHGAKFEDLVTKYSDEPGSAARGGDLGLFKKGMMVPEFQQAVESLQVGKVGMVETPFGFHLILRTQ